MKNFIKASILIVFLVASSFVVNAQKFGYVNTQLILSEMPEVKEMNANLETLQKQLTKRGQTMVTGYKKKEEEAVKKKERGELSPKQEEELLASLQVEQTKIMEYEKEMQQQLLEKQQQLETPIVEKINSAINQVAKENGYTMIFDGSMGIILYADDNVDLSNLVKAKLGMGS